MVKQSLKRLWFLIRSRRKGKIGVKLKGLGKGWNHPRKRGLI